MIGYVDPMRQQKICRNCGKIEHRVYDHSFKEYWATVHRFATRGKLGFVDRFWRNQDDVIYKVFLDKEG